ncbi:hypothetical protein P152DRAFT_462812 [Eremomyces bilateralis CBS 781.70]|uniref:Uncharacterized protein n=1 Tax=Eremomyces bilateralis CBS 781.70 TaxID=1392243 RepID=A0A6G1FQY0_9PEZI|nr:uncharacterized protein P152DRAFT_462812 [Eremomyces bilateralis CBS 781.70]KAF1808156.1 hypothetical protein P152DRAFT_462812 [Eremomyces bilateralis CBS 781.70]
MKGINGNIISKSNAKTNRDAAEVPTTPPSEPAAGFWPGRSRSRTRRPRPNPTSIAVSDPISTPPPSSNGTVDAQFGCAAASDCVVKDVRNCCGYYPKCVNSGFKPLPPKCDGGVFGVCGFPVIDACDCQAERCVGLQNSPQTGGLSNLDSSVSFESGGSGEIS